MTEAEDISRAERAIDRALAAKDAVGLRPGPDQRCNHRMPQTDFAAEILETEIVLTHIEDGHVYHFPIAPNGTVSLNGSRVETNPDSKRAARKFLFDAHNTASAAFGRTARGKNASR
jgi:hypothetical protein